MSTKQKEKKWNEIQNTQYRDTNGTGRKRNHTRESWLVADRNRHWSLTAVNTNCAKWLNIPTKMGENSIRTMVLECYVIYVGWCRNKYHAPRWQVAQPENARIREVTCSHRYDLNFIHIEIYAFQLDVQNAKSKIGREAIWGEQSVLYTICAWNSRGTGVKSARHTGMYLQMSVRSICQYVVTMPRIDRMPCDCNAVLCEYTMTFYTTNHSEHWKCKFYSNPCKTNKRPTERMNRMRTTKWTILIRKHLGIGHLFSGSVCNFCYWALYTERVGNELSNIQSGCWFNKKFDYTLSIQLIRCWTYFPEMRFSTGNWHDHYEKHTKLSFWFVSGQHRLTHSHTHTNRSHLKWIHNQKCSIKVKTYIGMENQNPKSMRSKKS